MIKTCECDNRFMDKKYGKKRRVFNPTMKNRSGSGAYRCAVCGKEKS